MLFGLLKGGNQASRDLLTARHAPAANTAAIITIAAVAGMKIQLHKVFSSYDTDPTAGSLLIESPASTAKFKVFIVKAGPVPLTFSPRTFAENTAVVITLAAGGGTSLAILEAEYTLVMD